MYNDQISELVVASAYLITSQAVIYRFTTKFEYVIW